tara:strand:- start:2422 stop:2718 length:297 start_codon:yes stop_codon:yes gene_type:complete
MKSKIRVRDGKRSANNQRKPRIGQLRVNPRIMPATIIHKQWLDDGSQVAICQINDNFIAARFDANEQIMGKPQEFKWGGARTRAMEWVKEQAKIHRSF